MDNQSHKHRTWKKCGSHEPGSHSVGRSLCYKGPSVRYNYKGTFIQRYGLHGVQDSLRSLTLVHAFTLFNGRVKSLRNKKVAHSVFLAQYIGLHAAIWCLSRTPSNETRSLQICAPAVLWSHMPFRCWRHRPYPQGAKPRQHGLVHSAFSSDIGIRKVTEGSTVEPACYTPWATYTH